MTQRMYTDEELIERLCECPPEIVCERASARLMVLKNELLRLKNLLDAEFKDEKLLRAENVTDMAIRLLRSQKDEIKFLRRQSLRKETV